MIIELKKQLKALNPYFTYKIIDEILAKWTSKLMLHDFIRIKKVRILQALILQSK